MQNSVYILFSQKLNKYYVGSTSDLNRRLSEHNRGKEKFTKTGLPWQLVYFETCELLADARKREKEIKNRKSRTYIENLICAAG